jgi:hypothetical protein
MCYVVFAKDTAAVWTCRAERQLSINGPMIFSEIKLPSRSGIRMKRDHGSGYEE